MIPKPSPKAGLIVGWPQTQPEKSELQKVSPTTSGKKLSAFHLGVFKDVPLSLNPDLASGI